MNPFTKDAKDILEDAGVGVFGATKGWVIFISREREQPNTAITLYDTPSPISELYMRTEHPITRLPNCQVRVRGDAKADGYNEAWDKINEAYEVLINRGPFMVGTVQYAGIVPVFDIEFLKYDESERPIFIFNMQAVKEDTVSR